MLFRSHPHKQLVNPKVTKGPRIRHNQWRYVDYDGDGALDLVVGVEDWSDYGWDDAYDATGKWTNGPLHGFVYWLKNLGTTAQPRYDAPRKIEAGGRPIDTFGCPSPNFVDFDGDGDLDLICGEFLDGFTYFENIGSRTKPVYAAGRRLRDQPPQFCGVCVAHAASFRSSHHSPPQVRPHSASLAS